MHKNTPLFTLSLLLACGTAPQAFALENIQQNPTDPSEEKQAQGETPSADKPVQNENRHNQSEEDDVIIMRHFHKVLGVGISGIYGDPYADNILQNVSTRAESFENILREQVGLQQFRRSDARTAHPTSQGMTIRGVAGNATNRVSLIIDGVPQNDPFGGWISFPAIDALPLYNGNLRRGAGIVRGGGLAGKTEIHSHIDSEDELSLSYGSHDDIWLKSHMASALGDGHALAYGQYREGNGYNPIVKEQRGAVDRGAQYQNYAIGGRMVAPMNDSVELQGNLRFFYDQRDRGYDFSDSIQKGADASLRLIGGDDWRWSAMGYLQLRQLYTSFGSVSDDRNSVSKVFEQYNVPSRGYGFNFELQKEDFSHSHLTFGLDWQRNEGTTNEAYFFQNDVAQRQRHAGGNSDVVGVYGEYSWAPEKWSITAQGRIDYWHIGDGFLREVERFNPTPGAIRTDIGYDNRDGWEPSGRLDIGYDITEDTYVRLSGYSGWRLPTLNELFRPFRVGADATAANSDLQPERLSGGEVALSDWSFDDALQNTIRVFYNHQDNAIANVTLAQGPGLFDGVGFVSSSGSYAQRQNLDYITSLGVELSGSFEVSDNLNLHYSYAYIDSEIHAQADQPGIDGNRPAQIPHHFANVDVDYTPLKDITLGVKVNYMSSQFDDDLEKQRLDDALTVDASFQARITDKLIVTAALENIFDARVETAISGNGLIERSHPRFFSLGLSYNFD